MFKKLKDTVFVGFAIGICIPSVLIACVWYFGHILFKVEKINLLLILCVAVNAISLQYFFKYNKENIGRGILGATFIWAILFLYYKTL